MISKWCRKIHKRSLVIAAGCTISLLVLYYFAFGVYHLGAQSPAKIVHDSTEKTANTLTPKPINHSLPARLEIPKLNVDTDILYMGLTVAGDMEVPTNVISVGWYKYGPLPGNKGSAVIAGHVDGLQGQPGVFADLSKLQPGDKISVIDSLGQTVSFVVTASQTYDQDAQPSEVFNSSDGLAHLNLITCTGTWDASEHRFAERLVVFTNESS